MGREIILVVRPHNAALTARATR